MQCFASSILLRSRIAYVNVSEARQIIPKLDSLGKTCMQSQVLPYSKTACRYITYRTTILGQSERSAYL